MEEPGWRRERRERLALQRVIGLGAPVTSIIRYLFSRSSEQERESMVATLKNAGVTQGTELHRINFQQLHDELGFPEKACKVLLDRGNILPGPGPDLLMWYGSNCYKSMPHGAHREVPQRLDDIATSADLDADLKRKYGLAVSGDKRWIQIAQEHMSDEEQADAMCNRADTQIIYGYRAMLRIISRIFPVNLSLVESSSFIGTMYMVAKSKSCEHLDPAVAPDWSRVVWVLQAKPPGMEYFEAMGRVAVSIGQMFAHQPGREFAFGIVGVPDCLDIYMFEAKDQKTVEGKTVAVPKTVTNSMLTIDRCHSGVEMLMMFMCADPCTLGFVSAQEFEL